MQQQEMTSSAAEQPPLMNGDEDPYMSEGRIEHKIENLSEFVQEELFSRRLSDNQVNLCGVAWKVLTIFSENDQQPAQNGQKQKCLDFCLQYGGSTDPFRSYAVKAKMKILAQKKGSVDHVQASERTYKFNGFDADNYSFLADIPIDDLMNPDRGLYDEKTDCIVLVMDLTVETTTDERGGEGGNGKYVLVAENELKLDKVPIVFSMQIGHLEWEINFDFDDEENKNGKKSVSLSCRDIARGADKVLLELFGYRKDNGNPYSAVYSPICELATAHRHLFTRKTNFLIRGISAGFDFNNLLFTVRMYKECSLFPDFTKSSAMVGRFSADVKLRVGDQQFHVNRQMLSMHSLFFDRMFHGDYTAATQQEVELSLKTHSPELFHDFLLVLCVNEILPNSMNVAALFKLADFYDAENVHQKCDQHLRMAREMPIEKRVLLARDHGSSETQTLIMDSVDLEQSKRVNLMFMQNRSL